MEFINAMDKLPKIAKILLAIFLPIIYTIYMIIRDAYKYKNNYLPLILDIVFGTVLGIVNWILNILYIVKDEKPVDYGVLFNLASGEAPKAEEAKEDKEPSIEALEEKPEEPEEAAEEQPEEKPEDNQ